MMRFLLSIFLLLVVTFSFAQRPAFPLKVSQNRRYLVDGQGTPFLYHADTGWQLFARLTLVEAREYLALRQQQGFNTIQVMLSVNPDSVSRKGEKPFKDYDFGA